MLNLLKIIQIDVLFEFIYDIFLFQNLVLLKRVKYLVLLFDSNLNLPVPIVLYSVHPMQCYSRPISRRPAAAHRTHCSVALRLQRARCNGCLITLPICW